ncbi:hypothetical protein DYU11_19985 [Fibrisoma montanum]|uniref:Uncharacterized protein n=1 Tax=Fibrisoma montanum TaxID=2305895 RepID=A0A418M3V1_9BACT|nr:hypothetical protein [Fibrisoma montanum]RIV20334.1 hypothetical protein DYU11_19985 [Fibrisoma montanum]
MANYGLPISGTAYNEGFRYRLSRGAFASAWQDYPFSEFIADPEDGGPIRTGVVYLVTAENPDTRVELTAYVKLNSNGVPIPYDGLGSTEPPTPDPDTLDSVARNGNITGQSLRADGGFGRAVVQEVTADIDGVAVWIGTAVKFIEKMRLSVLRGLMGLYRMVLTAPEAGQAMVLEGDADDGWRLVNKGLTLNDVAIRGNVTAQLIQADGGFARADFSRFEGTPYGMLVALPGNPKFVERALPPEVRNYLNVLATTLSGPVAGQLLALRQTPSGSWEHINVNRDNFADVTGRGNTTPDPIRTTGYVREGLTGVERAWEDAVWVEIAPNIWAIEARNAKRRADQTLELMDDAALYEKIKLLIPGNQELYQLYEIVEVRCIEVEVEDPVSYERIDITSGDLDDEWDHPYANPEALFWSFYHSGGGQNTYVDFDVRTTPFKAKLTSAPASMLPLSGTLIIDYKP